jgi:hypothetical protein
VNKYQRQASILSRNSNIGELNYKELKNGYLRQFKINKWSMKRILKFKKFVMDIRR